MKWQQNLEFTKTKWKTTAVQLDPNNTEYQMHLRRMQNPGQTYRTQTTYAQPGGLMRWCWSMILLNLLCNCCCGGGWGWRFRM